MTYDFIESTDPESAKILRAEDERQRDGLELIPSENYISAAVREAVASTMSNKYSEGYPGKRYYGGQVNTDAIEQLAIDRAKKLFNANFVNVQPHSGSNANLALYYALLKPGDTVLGMDLSHGGHLTHGHPVTSVTSFFKFVRYKMKDLSTGEIDYEGMRTLALEHKPAVLLAGYSAYSRELDYNAIASIAREVGAVSVMDAAHIAGLIAGGAHANPLACGIDVMTTTTHKTLRGPRGGMILTNNDELARKIDKSVFPGFQGGPLMNHVAGKAVAYGEALQPTFKAYAKQVIENARAMAAVFQSEGVRLVGGGTDNHLVLADITSFSITGDIAEKVLDDVGLTVNKNVIADDVNPPMRPSGIRFGTPALTTRGFGESSSRRVAELMIAALKARNSSIALEEIHAEVRALSRAHPVPEVF